MFLNCLQNQIFKAVVLVFPTAICFAIILASGISLAGQPTKSPLVQVAHYSLEQGLSERLVTSIVRDKQGYLWIATYNGLNRFDGNEFLTFDTRPKSRYHVRSNGLSRLWLDRNGRLLIDDYHKPITAPYDLLDPLTGARRTVSIAQPEGIVSALSAIFQAADHTIYFANLVKDQLMFYSFNEKNGSFVPLIKTHIRENILNLEFMRARDGSFWISGISQHQQAVVLHLSKEGQVQQTFYLDDFYPMFQKVPKAIYITETGDGKILLINVNQSVYILDNTVSTRFQEIPGFPKNYYAFGKDNIGNIMVYSIDAKDAQPSAFLYSIDGNLLNYSWLFQYQGALQGLYSEDFTKFLLAGSKNGFYSYNLLPGWFTNYLNRPSGNLSSGISIRGMAKVQSNKILIGTDYHGLFELDLGTQTVKKPGDTAPNLKILNEIPFIRNILMQGDSVAWITSVGGLYQYNVKEKTAQFIPNLPKDEIWGLNFDQTGNLWVLHWYGNLLHLDVTTQKTEIYANSDGKNPLQGSLLSYLITAKDGSLWVGTTVSGLFHIDPKTKQSVHFSGGEEDASGLNSNQIATLFEDPSGLIWVGTFGSGLQVLDPKTSKVVATYNQSNGLCNNNAVGILPDSKGNYWVSTFNGLSYFNVAQKTFRNFTTVDGLPHNEFNRHAAFLDPQTRRFYFGGLNGLVSFEEQSIEAEDALQPKLLVSEIQYPDEANQTMVQNLGILDGTTITINSENPFLRLKLGMSYFTNPDNNLFAYKMEGLDKDWNTLGNKSELRFDRLKPGNYTIRLRGADQRGIWSSQEIALKLKVQSLWYKRGWALFLYLTGLVLAGFFMYKYLVRKKHTQSTVLPALPIVEDAANIVEYQNLDNLPQATADKQGQDAPVSIVYDYDKQFVQKARQLVELHLSDTNFSVDQLCQKLTISQPQLHRRLTTLTGKNATLFIRQIRLEKAHELLLQGNLSVKEVAFEVGFNDPKYFSRVFVETFGIPPSKVR
jgi:ligand-binding sensor domain-containing protein/AraC-like DNA-binding protein